MVTVLNILCSVVCSVECDVEVLQGFKLVQSKPNAKVTCLVAIVPSLRSVPRRSFPKIYFSASQQKIHGTPNEIMTNQSLRLSTPAVR